MFGVENVGSATRRDLSQRSSGDTAILYDHWPFATIRVFAGSECTGEKGDHIRAISPNFIVQYKVIHLRLSLGLIRPVFLFTASSSPPIIYRQISMERLFRRMTDTQKPTEDEMRSKENA